MKIIRVESVYALGLGQLEEKVNEKIEYANKFDIHIVDIDFILDNKAMLPYRAIITYGLDTSSIKELRESISKLKNINI